MTVEYEKNKNFFYYKDYFFTIRSLFLTDINKEYLNSLKNSTFLESLPKNINLNYQKKYIKRINKSTNETILGVFNNKKLIFTSHFTNLNKKAAYLGIFLFSKKFLGKKFSSFFILQVCLFINFKYNIYHFKAGVDNLNFRSKKSFLKAGFKVCDKKKKSAIYYLDLTKIKKTIFNE
jgi:RimJ/RimL family protein N-acetyltransferase